MTLLERHALRFANRIREDQGLRPRRQLPPGRPRSDHGCPIAKAIHGDAARMNCRAAGRLYFYSPLVWLFVARFDAGKYRHLREPVRPSIRHLDFASELYVDRTPDSWGKAEARVG